MRLLWEGLLTLLSALGLALLGGLLFARLLHPFPSSGFWVLLPGRGAGESLERDLRSLMWLRELGLMRCGVAVVDCGMSEEGLEVARRLARRWPDTVLCPEKEVRELLRRT